MKIKLTHEDGESDALLHCIKTGIAKAIKDFESQHGTKLKVTRREFETYEVLDPNFQSLESTTKRDESED